MGINETADGRQLDVRPDSNPEPSPFRLGSLIAQLENDRFYDGDGHDAADIAYRRGHNAIVNHAITYLQRGWTPQLDDVSEDHPNDPELAAYSRGRNAGARHVRELARIDAEFRANAGLAELAQAHPVVTTELHTAPELDDEARARRFDIETADGGEL